jgi:hypothetical protein
MLAQRERAINAHFSHVPGRSLSEVDLIRSLLFDCLSSEDERETAYDDFWRPLEEKHGDGDPVVLASFLGRFVAQQERGAIPVELPVPEGECVALPVSSSALEADEVRVNVAAPVALPMPESAAVADNKAALEMGGESADAVAALLATRTPLRDKVAALLRDRGGGGGSRDIYGAGAAEACIVAPEAAGRAALSLLREMHDVSLTAEVASGASGAATRARLVPVDLWDPAQQLRRLQEQRSTRGPAT